MDLALNNCQRLICHKTEPTNMSKLEKKQQRINDLLNTETKRKRFPK